MFQISLTNEGYGFLLRGLTSTIIRAFPMNAATFFVYDFVMKTFKNVQNEDNGYSTFESLGRKDSHSSILNKLPCNTCANFTTVTTDMPNILLVKEPLNISQVKLYILIIKNYS